MLTETVLCPSKHYQTVRNNKKGKSQVMYQNIA